MSEQWHLSTPLAQDALRLKQFQGEFATGHLNCVEKEVAKRK